MISMKNKKFLHEFPMLFLFGMLVFSHPLMTASVAAKDAKSDVKAEAKLDAERDAKNVHELWFAGGCLGSCGCVSRVRLGIGSRMRPL